MKYMTFNSSCSYTGVANMLAPYGVETDDRTIAQRMMLPYLFAKEDGEYHSGPMLQSAQWFNLYLHPIGYTMEEKMGKAGTDSIHLAQHKGCYAGSSGFAKKQTRCSLFGT